MSELISSASARVLEELTRLRAELADALKANRELALATLDAQIALAQAKADAAAWNKSFHDANTERMRLRAALEHVVKADDEAISELRARGIVAADYDPVVAKIAREALATPAPVVPGHPPATPPPEGWPQSERPVPLLTGRQYDSVEALMEGEHVSKEVVAEVRRLENIDLLADAEELATALESLAARARYHVDCQPARIALAAWRVKHPEPTWLKGILDDVRAKHPPAETTARMP